MILENVLTAKFVVMFAICQPDRFRNYVSIYLLVIAMGPEAQLKHMTRDLSTLILFDVFLTVHHSIEFFQVPTSCGARGGLVVKALSYKPAGRGFDSRWCHWNFSVT